MLPIQKKGDPALQDDYAYLNFKILTDLYACFKRRCGFDEAVFHRKLLDGKLSDEYLTDVMRLMQNEGLIKGAGFHSQMGS